ncbi:MAG: hypothetical protein NXH95_20495 [Pseudomonadaceae bacterium]|nr:hypothetical protein [Pseudomonadaceae bacterium]
MMQNVQEQNEVVAALVKGSIAELAHRGFDVSRIGCSRALVSDEPRGSWRRVAQSISDPQTAEQAYFVLCHLVNVDHAVCRVLLDDVAEWLALSPMDYRRIRKAAQFEDKRRFAA